MKNWLVVLVLVLAAIALIVFILSKVDVSTEDGAALLLVPALRVKHPTG